MQHDPNGVGVYLYRTAAADQPSPAEICPDITRALDARNSFVVFFGSSRIRMGGSERITLPRAL